MDEELGAPASLEEEAPIASSQSAGPVAKTGKTGVTHESVDYTSAAERCQTCDYFDEDAYQCKKNKFECEPEGHCRDFKVIGEGGQPLPGAEAGEGEEGMVDLEEEELEGEEVY
jgi:hypothetical protein